MDMTTYEKDGYTMKNYEPNGEELMVLIYFLNDMSNWLNDNKIKWINQSEDKQVPDIKLIKNDKEFLIELEIQKIKSIPATKKFNPDFFHRKSYYCQTKIPCYIITYRSDHSHVKITSAKNIDWNTTVRKVTGEEMNGLKQGKSEGIDRLDKFKKYILKILGE